MSNAPEPNPSEPSECRPYPAALRVEGWIVLVVGGGPVATRKVFGFLPCGARIRLVAPEVTQELADAALVGDIDWIPRTYRTDDLNEARLVLAATHDPRINAAVENDAHQRGLLVYRADQAALSDWHTPALFHAAGLLGTIQTLGTAPHAAAYVRRRLEEFARAELEPAVAVLTHLRQQIRQLPLSPSLRTDLLRQALSTLVQRIEDGHDPADALRAGAHAAELWLQTHGRSELVDPQWMNSVRAAPRRLTEEQAMDRALQLAQKGLGRTSPNPMVGALILSPEGHILGEGWHASPGQPHGEIQALRDAEDRGNADRIPGSTLVVTLEPCCHHGRTGPCTEAIIQARIRRVVAACSDPNPRVAGQGFQQLTQQGMDVHCGLREQQSQDLNAGFITVQRIGRSLLTAKWAMTLDGRLATHTGQSRWITGPSARRHVHQWRARHDAILVGSATILADNPALTVRLDPLDWPCPEIEPLSPRIVVVDGSLQLSPESRFLHPANGFPADRAPIIATALPPAFLAAPDPNTPEPIRHRVQALRDLGCVLLSLPQVQDPRHVDLTQLVNLLAREFDICSIYAEGGGVLHGHLFGAGLVDRVHAYIAPKLVSGPGPYHPLFGPGVDQMELAAQLERVEVESLGVDLFLSGWMPAPPTRNPTPSRRSPQPS
jgi:diaminohydroxyphosphoribosylaminopyrimidine deaminase/5-amino-6-(5-phosphoribosylamino)uracil reductase